MSKYLTIETKYTDYKVLIDTLNELNFNPEISENIRENSLNLNGWRNSQQVPVAIALRKGHDTLNTFGDIGFAWDGESYRAIIDDYDLKKMKDKIDKLNQTYSVNKVMKDAKANGYSLRKKVEKNGEVRLVMVMR